MSRTNRTWTPEENALLIEMVERHHSYREIAAYLHRTPAGCQERASVLGVRLRDANGRTLRATAVLLGLDFHAVQRWIQRGWLRGHKTTARIGQGVFTIIEHEDLTEFLENEEHWHWWKPERITDFCLREWVTELRHGINFLTTGQVAERLCVTHYRVNQWIRQGRLRAVKAGRNWLVRSDWVTYPEWKPKYRTAPITGKERATIKRLWGRKPATEIAQLIGKSGTAVGNHARYMGLPPLGRGRWKRVSATA